MAWTFSFQGCLCPQSLRQPCHSLFLRRVPAPGMGTAFCHHSSPEDAFRHDEPEELIKCVSGPQVLYGFSGKIYSVKLHLFWNLSPIQGPFKRFNALLSFLSALLTGLESWEELDYQERSFLWGTDPSSRAVGMAQTRARLEGPRHLSRASCCVVFGEGQRQRSCSGAVSFRVGSPSTFTSCRGNKVPRAKRSFEKNKWWNHVVLGIDGAFLSKGWSHQANCIKVINLC